VTLLLWVGGAQRLLRVFQPEAQLIRIEPFRTRPEAIALECYQDGPQGLGLAAQSIPLTGELRDRFSILPAFRQQQSTEGLRIGRESLDIAAHAKDFTRSRPCRQRRRRQRRAIE
jgi:hypothetical protein